MKILIYIAYTAFSFFARPFYSINNEIIVFGSRGGVAFEGNGKYLFLHACKSKTKRYVWIAKSQKVVNEVRSYGYEAYHYLSSKGFKLCMSASKIYITHSMFDSAPILWRKGQTIIDLWHGIPIKKVAFSDINVQKVSRLMDLYKSLRLDFLICHNEESLNIYKENFRINSYKILPYGSPRIEFLKKYKHKRIYDNVNLKDFREIYLYAPTFRDYNYKDPFLELAFLKTLDKFLEEKNSYLFVKLHPLLDSFESKIYSNINFLSSNVDVYEILPFSNVLITDYSGLSADFISAFPDRRLIIFAPDFDRYMKIRGFNVDFRSSFSEIVEKCSLEMFDISSEVLNVFFSAKSSNACDKILNINE